MSSPNVQKQRKVHCVLRRKEAKWRLLVAEMRFARANRRLAIAVMRCTEAEERAFGVQLLWIEVEMRCAQMQKRFASSESQMLAAEHRLSEIDDPVVAWSTDQRWKTEKSGGLRLVVDNVTEAESYYNEVESRLGLAERRLAQAERLEGDSSPCEDEDCCGKMERKCKMKVQSYVEHEKRLYGEIEELEIKEIRFIGLSRDYLEQARRYCREEKLHIYLRAGLMDVAISTDDTRRSLSSDEIYDENLIDTLVSVDIFGDIM